jgi:hypothetical protein
VGVWLGLGDAVEGGGIGGFGDNVYPFVVEVRALGRGVNV